MSVVGVITPRAQCQKRYFLFAAAARQSQPGMVSDSLPTSPMSSSLEHVVPHVNVLSPHRRSGNRWLGLPLPKSADCVEEAEVPLLKDAKYACEKNDLSRFRR
jgi:hypothetical protein